MTIILNRSFQSHTSFSLFLVFNSSLITSPNNSFSSCKTHTQDWTTFSFFDGLGSLRLPSTASSQFSNPIPATWITFTHPSGSRKSSPPPPRHGHTCMTQVTSRLLQMLYISQYHSYHLCCKGLSASSSLDSKQALYVQGPRRLCSQF